MSSVTLSPLKSYGRPCKQFIRLGDETFPTITPEMLRIGGLDWRRPGGYTKKKRVKNERNWLVRCEIGFGGDSVVKILTSP